MLILLSLSLVSLTVASLLATVALALSKKLHNNRDKLTPFECGFTPKKSARSPFSLRFFLMTILFLVFDVEVALLMPFGLVLNYCDPAMSTAAVLSLTIVISAGLLHEWNQGALSWVM
nr:TPA_asm: ND3 [Baikalogammarus pullus]